MGAYHLYRSSSLESFLERFPDLFLSAHPLCDPVYIVVQNAGLGEWLIRRLTRERGAVMGARILMPEQAMRLLVGGYPAARALLSEGFSTASDGAADSGGNSGADSAGSSGADSGGEAGERQCSLLYMDGLKLTLYKALQEAVGEGAGGAGGKAGGAVDPVFDAPARYAAGKPGRLWGLAGALAGIFHYYSANCGGLVESWERGRGAHEGASGGSGTSAGAGASDASGASGAAGGRGAEAWQRRLWRRVFHGGAPYSYLSRVLRAACESAEGCGPAPVRVVLFGSMFLGEQGLRFFRRLGDDFDVHHFVLSPTANRGELRTLFLQNNAALPAGFEAVASGLNPTSEDDYRPNPGDADSTLHRLRESFIHDRAFEGAVSDDGSLALHDVSGPRRTVEVLKDRILEALRDDPDLAPTEIGVLAPDIALYAPYLEIVFPSLDDERQPRRDHLPFNMSDLPSGGQGAFAAALDALMELPGSRFGRPALIALIENPCFAPAAGREELADGWKSLIDQMNIRWGVDADHRRSMGAADLYSGSWEFAFERIFAGYCRDEGDTEDILPRADAGDPAAEDAGILMQVIRDLDSQVRRLDERTMGLGDWTQLWERITVRFLRVRSESDEDEADMKALKNAFRDLLALCDDVDDLSDFADRTLPWPVFRDMLNEFRCASAGRKGRWLARGVTCASLKPTRAIPFRRIYVLGLDEGAWPGRDVLTGFDLRGEYAGAMDLSREAVDRLALLEVFFSASEHLSLFYTGRDPQNGEPLAPSAPVLELLDHLGEGAEGLIRHHPLRPFDYRALSGGGPLATGSAEAASLALALGSPKRSPEPPRAQPLPPGEEMISINWRRLIRFLKNPVEHFFRYSIGADISGIEDAGDEGDVLDADRLRWWTQRRNLLRGDIAVFEQPQARAREFEARLRGEGAFARSPAEVFQLRRFCADAESLANQLEGFEGSGLLKGEAFACRFTDSGGGADSGIDPRVFENGGSIERRAPQISTNTVIEGRVEGLRLLEIGGRRDREVWTLVEFADANTPGVKHGIESWAAALMLGAALGDDAPREIRVFRVGSEASVRRCFLGKAAGKAAGEAAGEAAGRRGDAEVGGDSRNKRGGKNQQKTIILENPREILGRLEAAYREGMRVPIWLYPEVADELTGMPGDVSPEVFMNEAQRAWERVIGNRYRMFTGPRDCPWRARFLREPDFASPAVLRFWRDIYAEGGLG